MVPRVLERVWSTFLAPVEEAVVALVRTGCSGISLGSFMSSVSDPGLDGIWRKPL